MTKRSQRPSSIGEGASLLPRRHTVNSTEEPRLMLTITVGPLRFPNRGSISQCQGIKRPPTSEPVEVHSGWHLPQCTPRCQKGRDPDPQSHNSVIWSVGQDNSQSWVRISYGTNKYVIDSNQNNTEILANPHEDQVSQTSIKVVAARSKAKAKPQQREPVDTTTTIPMHERRWIDIEPSEQTLAVYDLSKKGSAFFDTIKQYSGKKMEQFNSGELNFIFEIIIHKYRIGLMIDGKLVWLQEEDRNEDISIALIIQEQFSTSALFKDILEAISLILRYRTM